MDHIREEIRLEKLKWLNIVRPNESDIKYLGRKYKFHRLDLDDCISINQRPKIDEYADYLFITLHFPLISKKNKRIHVSEVHFFISNNLLITIHEDHPTIGKLFDRCKKSKTNKEQYMAHSSGYLLYKIVDALFESCFPILDDLSKNLTDIESDIFHFDFRKDELKEILSLKKDITNFRRIIIPQRAVVAQLEHKNSKFLPETLEVYFDDIVDKIEKIWSTLENLKELAEILHETNETVISHNTNNIIKVLTVFSVIMLPMTVITGFYGMNLTPLPFSGHTEPILMVIGIMALVVIAMLGYFKFKKWI